MTKLKANKGKLTLINNGLATEIDVRFVSVTLDTGETEVLVTSLVDETAFKTEDFKGLYWFRWEIETFYGLLKTRLGLENFTGYHPEAIKQDIYSTIYLASLEAILTQQAQQILAGKQTQHPQKINRMVSFNVIKNNILDLLFTKEKTPDLSERLTALFLMNPTCCRKKSHPRRKKKDWQKSAEFQKWKKKVCF